MQQEVVILIDDEIEKSIISVPREPKRKTKNRQLKQEPPGAASFCESRGTQELVQGDGGLRPVCPKSAAILDSVSGLHFWLSGTGVLRHYLFDNRRQRRFTFTVLTQPHAEKSNTTL